MSGRREAILIPRVTGSGFEFQVPESIPGPVAVLGLSGGLSTDATVGTRKYWAIHRDQQRNPLSLVIVGTCPASGNFGFALSPTCFTPVLDVALNQVFGPLPTQRMFPGDILEFRDFAVVAAGDLWGAIVFAYEW